ncbi:MAG: PDZ domain-containing protein [Nitrospinaceae bacterium]
MGIDILSEEVAQQAKTKKNEGVLVNSVFQGQPAAQAGIEVGDIILRIGGSRVTSPNKMIRVIGNITPGQSVQVDILREGEHKTVSVQLAKRVEDPAWMASLENPSFIHLGFDVKPLDFSLQRKYGLPASEGLVVTRIRPGSTAETSGLRAGDLIRAINGRPTGSREDIEKILQDNPESDWFFLVIRQEKTLHLTLKFGEG